MPTLHFQAYWHIKQSEKIDLTTEKICLDIHHTLSQQVVREEAKQLFHKI